MTNREAIEVLQQDIPCEYDPDLIEAMRMAIAALERQEQAGWIPATERLPKKQTKVLVVDFGEVDTAYINSEGRWMDFYGDKLKDVTAWRPLPEPYQEDKA